MMRPCYCGGRQPPTHSPQVHHLALSRMWSESLAETLQTDNREWIYLYFYMRLARLVLMLPQQAASGALLKLSAENAQWCRCSKQLQKRSRVTLSCAPWLWGGRRFSSTARRHSKRVPVVCGGWMYKILSGVAGMLWFRACRVVNCTKQNILHTQSRKNKHLPNANRACNVCRG